MESEPAPERQQGHGARPGGARRIGLLLIAALLWLAINYFGPPASGDHSYVSPTPAQTPVLTPARVLPSPVTSTPSR